MDFATLQWDDVTQKFVDPPDNTAIYFWPFPKAVRLTINVCSIDRKSRITLSRIIHPMVGMGDAHITAAKASAGTDGRRSAAVQSAKNSGRRHAR